MREHFMVFSLSCAFAAATLIVLVGMAYAIDALGSWVDQEKDSCVYPTDVDHCVINNQRVIVRCGSTWKLPDGTVISTPSCDILRSDVK